MMFALRPFLIILLVLFTLDSVAQESFHRSKRLFCGSALAGFGSSNKVEDASTFIDPGSLPQMNIEEVSRHFTTEYSMLSMYVGEDTKKGIKLPGEYPDTYVKFKTQYLNESERSAYEVFVSDGVFYDNQGRPLCPGAKCKGLFVLGLDGKMYFSTRGKRGRFHHSSFVAGESVYFAGEPKFINGQLIMISNDAGHYKPDNITLKSIYSYFAAFGVKGYEIKSRQIVNSRGKIKWITMDAETFYLQEEDSQ